MTELNAETCIRQTVDIDKLRHLQKALHAHTDLEQLADLLAIAGNLTRLKMLYLLAEGVELCVCDMADVLGMTVSAVSHQLRRLRDRNVITQRREGTTIYYRLRPGPFTDVLVELFKVKD